VAQDLFDKKLSPEIIFRIVALACLVAMAFALIYVGSHASQLDADPVRLTRSKDLAAYFFIAIWIFVFFYLQYRFVPRLTKVPLDDRFGYAQSLGGAGLLFVGALHALMPQTSMDVPSGVLFWLTLLGEGVFIANVVWSYTHAGAKPPVVPRVSVTKPVASKLGDTSVKNLGWPKSPVKLFAIGAGFFAVGGLASLVTNFPSFKFPVPWSGEMHFLPFGVLWFAAAVPFAIFAMLYQVLIDSYGLVFEDSMNRIHFWVTIIAVFVMVRAFTDWQQSMISKTWAFFFPPQYEWLYLLLFLSLMVFVLSAYRSFRRLPSRK
jgi:hypothetical protein